ncbi:hypothetical protein SAMN05877753_11132 [Bacillus oleivorans]|uniref:Uncharacterized protein n=1 Tax=Bacillus oleivorans TaxID=1448271 RepID=A0A285D5U5_9BACI|nr:hypothetical protein [Bacillus oleivorans]SNX75149.1 hypothetical protein SAMN05877753_11132 [Bacillus oleivorans]
MKPRITTIEFNEEYKKEMEMYENTLKNIVKRRIEEIDEAFIMDEYKEEVREDKFNIRLFQIIIFIVIVLLWKPL